MPGKSSTPASLHACSAIKSTCRRDASSNAIAVANSETGEPSTPTRTGACAGCGINVLFIVNDRDRTMSVMDQADTHRPSRAPNAPWPRQPTTTISASFDMSTSVGTMAE